MPIELPPGTAAYSAETPPPNNRQLLSLLSMFLMAVCVTIGVSVWLAGAVVWFIPTEVEQQLGRAIVPVFEAQSEPSATQDTLNELLDRLEVHLAEEHLAEVHSERDYQVLYVPDDTVNALAIPGDRIIIYKGLLADLQSENELMMILGHELGHFANRDHLRGLSRQLLVRLSLATVFGDLGSLVGIATDSAIVLSDAQFSQSQEKQADEVGLTLLAKEYGQVAGATDFFVRLGDSGVPGLAILASHPPSTARVRNIEQLIKSERYNVGKTQPLSDELIFEAG